MFYSKVTNVFAVFVVMVAGTCRGFNEETDTIVHVPNLGSIQGKIIETAWSKREVLQFVDVKYAEPPSGKHRFKVGRLCVLKRGL